MNNVLEAVGKYLSSEQLALFTKTYNEKYQEYEKIEIYPGYKLTTQEYGADTKAVCGLFRCFRQNRGGLGIREKPPRGRGLQIVVHDAKGSFFPTEIGDCILVGRKLRCVDGKDFRLVERYAQIS